MNEAEVLARWRGEKPLYQAWGDFVVQCVKNQLAKIIAPRAIEEVVKIPPVPRLKTDSSLIDKAIHRKRYARPYDDVEDKVGVRFVVLLTRDIRSIIEAIEACGFETSKDRDYEEERAKHPLEFAYQSVHFVVRNREVISVGELQIPVGLPCEIQIRTLLQHAHSEITHDRVYKGNREAPVSVKRTLAKSMALIETTDDFFSGVVKELDDLDRPTRQIFMQLSAIYNEQISPNNSDNAKSNIAIIDALATILGEQAIEATVNLLNAKPFLRDRIKSHALHNHLYRQPAILFAYLSAHSKPSELLEKWPLTRDELRPVFTDLGKNIDGF